MLYKCFDKKASGGAIKSMSNQQLSNELHKPIVKNVLKRRDHSSFKGNIWGTDLADIQLISKSNKEIRFLCVIDIFSKYGCAVPLKGKKFITVVNAFGNILNSLKRKPNKIWVDKGS